MEPSRRNKTSNTRDSRGRHRPTINSFIYSIIHNDNPNQPTPISSHHHIIAYTQQATGAIPRAAAGKRQKCILSARITFTTTWFGLPPARPWTGAGACVTAPPAAAAAAAVAALRDLRRSLHHFHTPPPTTVRTAVQTLALPQLSPMQRGAMDSKRPLQDEENSNPDATWNHLKRPRTRTFDIASHVGVHASWHGGCQRRRSISRLREWRASSWPALEEQRDAA